MTPLVPVVSFLTMRTRQSISKYLLSVHYVLRIVLGARLLSLTSKKFSAENTIDM